MNEEMSEKSDELPEVFSIFEQKLAQVLSFTVVPLKSKDMKNALAEILTYFSGIVERANKAEARIAELEEFIGQLIEAGNELTANPSVGNYAEREAAWTKLWLKWRIRNE